MKWTVKEAPEGAQVRLTERQGTKPGILFLEIEVELDRPQIPKPVRLQTVFPAENAYSVWTPRFLSERHLGKNWSRITSASRFAVGAPIHCLVSHSGENCFTAALSDACVTSELSSGIIEETAEAEFVLTLFALPQEVRRHYRAVLYVDAGGGRYEDAIRGATKWWETECGYKPMAVPKEALRPMYSTWYAFHQALSPEEILRDCRAAKAMGMDSVIIDDGWETDSTARGFSHTGDWRLCREKIPDMRALTDGIHALGMKVLLWFAPPFAGVCSEAEKRFSDRTLTYRMRDGARDAAILDPRFPEVRDYIADVIVKAVEEWDLDGLKLDFIDRFRLEPDTPEEDPRRDMTSVEAAAEVLMKDIVDRSSAIRPDLLIEFRQNYFGPAVRRYGNMIRVADCPMAAFVNRRSGIDLRLLCGGSAVHSDMLEWCPDDRAESAAKQVIAALFCVPQISMRPERLPEDHRKMIVHFLSLQEKHRETIFEGALYADDPESGYTVARAEKDGDLFAVAWVEKPVVWTDGVRAATVVNGTGGGALALRFPREGVDADWEVFDCRGVRIREGAGFLAGLAEFAVPDAGVLTVKKR
ncbi:MAG: alpha-galactosidase [Clostridia bacterium]|nr:alpha-galactosidase [Clostridia bacterium]